MTVSTDLARISYSGDGISVSFPIPFYFLANTELAVYLVDGNLVETLQVYGVDYTVTGAGNPAGGTLIMGTALAVDLTLVILRDVPETQNIDYVENDPFPAESHERGLDRLTMIAQQHREILDRTVRVAPTSTFPGFIMPNPEAQQLLGWDNSATVLTNYPSIPMEIPPLEFITAYGTLAAAVASIGLARTSLCINVAVTDSTDVVVPENISLCFLEGGRLDFGASTCTINGRIVATATQIFGTGIFVFGSKTIEKSFPEWFGALPNVEIDQGIYFEKLLTAIGTLGIPIILSGGIYWIDATYQTYITTTKCGIKLRENSCLHFSGGSEIRTLANDYDAGAFFTILARDVSNITLESPKIRGEGDIHTGTVEQNGMVLGILSCNNVKIIDSEISYAWSGGIYIGGYPGSAQPWSENILIENPYIHHCRWINIAIISGKKISITDPLCTDAVGGISANPGSGIHIEPDDEEQYVEAINIVRPRTIDNGGSGIVVTLGQLTGGAGAPIPNTDRYVSINIDKLNSINDQRGIAIWGVSAALRGAVKISDPIIINSDYSGIMINAYSYQGPKIEIHNPIIYDPNNAGTSDDQYGSGLSVFRETGYVGGTDYIGNVHVYNPTIVDSRITTKMRYCFYTRDSKTGAPSPFSKNITFLDPIALSGYATALAQPCAFYAGTCKISDPHRLLEKSVGADFTLGGGLMGKWVNNTGATGTVIITLGGPTALPDAFPEITYEVTAAQILRLVPIAGESIIPYEATTAKYILCNVVGSTVTLTRVGTNWRIKEITGRWVTEDAVVINLYNSYRKTGTTAQRPSLSSSAAGFVYYDTTTLKFIGWDGASWINLN